MAISNNLFTQVFHNWSLFTELALTLILHWIWEHQKIPQKTKRDKNFKFWFAGEQLVKIKGSTNDFKYLQKTAQKGWK